MNVIIGTEAISRRGEVQTVAQVQADLTNWKALLPSKALTAFLVTPPSSSLPRVSSFARLPLDCIGCIFEYLPIGDLVRRAARVSVAWSRIIKRLGIWRQFDLAALMHRSEVFIGKPLKFRSEFWLGQLASGRFGGLRSVNLSTASVHHRELGRILRAAPGATSLDFSHCDGFDDACCVTLGDVVRSRCDAALATIKVNFNIGFAGHTLACAIENVAGLKCLEVSGCTQFRNDDFSRFFTSIQLLETFKARGTSFTHVAFTSFTAALPHLRVLDLSMCSGVTDEALAAISTKCPNLVSLSLDSCAHVTDSGLQVLIAAHMEVTEMHTLHVAGCRNLSDSSLRSIPSAFARTMRRLAVDRTRMSGSCLFDLLTRLNRLESLSCSECVFARKDLAFSASIRMGCSRESNRLAATSAQFLGLCAAAPRRNKTL